MIRQNLLQNPPNRYGWSDKPLKSFAKYSLEYGE
jgi:hypothetical protein